MFLCFATVNSSLRSAFPSCRGPLPSEGPPRSGVSVSVNWEAGRKLYHCILLPAGSSRGHRLLLPGWAEYCVGVFPADMSFFFSFYSLVLVLVLRYIQRECSCLSGCVNHRRATGWHGLDSAGYAVTALCRTWRFPLWAECRACMFMLH